MARITTLDQNTIDMIAAGEVIERPASIVKELMENSIDAGAQNITVSVKEGGKKSIKVTDDGQGMDRNDLDMAFKSHSTSKLKDPSDLSNIATLGFRGEALASIAAVAQITAFSRKKNSIEGSSIEIDAGKQTNLRPCSCDYGSSIEVRDIFYKIPVRRKFLKTANTEMSHISEQFARIALPNPKLSFTLIHNQKEIHKLTADQPIRERIADLFSSKIADNLLYIQKKEKEPRGNSTSTKTFTVTALLGHPDISRANSKFQYSFLNGRFIRDKFISHAVKESYRGFLEANRHPVVFLFLTLPFQEYDVNVHPTKIEVRFQNSNLIHSQILATIRETLLKTNLDARAKIPADQTAPGGPTASEHERTNQIKNAIDQFFKKHRPAHQQPSLDFPRRTRTAQLAKQPEQTFPPPAYPQLERKFFQIHDSFIIAQTEEGFIVIDQHALHERILYEQLQKRISKGNLEAQKLLIPETLELTPAQIDLLKNHAEIIERLGIEHSAFGPKTYAVQAFPQILAKASPAEFLQDLLDLLQSKKNQIEPPELLHQILSLAACKAAIKAGQKLNDSEIQQLIDDKELVQHSSRCPHGRPTVIKFSIKELEKQFKRT